MRHFSLPVPGESDEEDVSRDVHPPPTDGRPASVTAGAADRSRAAPRTDHGPVEDVLTGPGRLPPTVLFAAAGGAVRRCYRNELISIVSSRPGPTPIAEIGAPDISSSAFTYAWAFFGRSENDFALVMSSDQPGSVS